jgi:high-affinity iron transporter
MPRVSLYQDQAVLVAALLLSSGTVAADDPSYSIAIKDHKFEPSEIQIAADTKIALEVKNLDPTPEEFESVELRREKVVPGGEKITVYIGPLKPEFFGDFNPTTARGHIIVKYGKRSGLLLGTAIIVFREVLEAALIVGIVLAASAGASGRNHWVSGGVVTGVAGACLVAVFAGWIAAAVSGIGQELFNATILFLAVGMLGWHIIWMSRHGRELAASARAVGDAVVSGSRPLYVLAVVCGVAVLREGSETVLFLYGIAAGGGVGVVSLMAGGVAGLAAGAVTGAVLYFGLLRIPTQRLFSVTNWLVLLLAAGMAAQAAGFLVQADLLPPLGEAVWDTSAVLTENSLIGKALHTLIGYVSRPEGVQVLFYLVTLLGIWLLSMWTRPQAGARRHVQAVLLAAGVLGSAALPAQADEPIFGFIYTTDLLPKGQKEVEQWLTWRHQKAGGYYDQLENRTEFSYGITDAFQLSGYLNYNWTHAYHNAVDGTTTPPEQFSDFIAGPDEHFSAARFVGASVEGIWRVLSPYTDPIGLGFYFEPTVGPFFREFETRLILQKNFLDDRLIIGSNLTFAPELRYNIPPPENETDVNASLGVSYRFAPSWSIAWETQYEREIYDVAIFASSKQITDAVYAGPTIHYAGERFFVTLTGWEQLPLAHDYANLGIIKNGRNYDVDFEGFRVRLRVGVLF